MTSVLFATLIQRFPLHQALIPPAGSQPLCVPLAGRCLCGSVSFVGLPLSSPSPSQWFCNLARTLHPACHVRRVRQPSYPFEARASLRGRPRDLGNRAGPNPRPKGH